MKARPAAPLALAQFVASYAGTNMNVAISDIAHDFDTSVHGVQIAITVFTLTMAALMIPGSKLTDIWGRKRCFLLGLVIYGMGALTAALSPSLGWLILGYSAFGGVGSALMIPPIYILVTSWFSGEQRAKQFGIVSAAAGVGAAAGPLIGGIITTEISWRASFIAQAGLVSIVILLARSISDPAREHGERLDMQGALLSAAGLFFIVLGVLRTGIDGWWLFVAFGALLLGFFFLHVHSWENKDKNPLLPLRLFTNRISNLGLATQHLQWLTLQGSFFVVSVFVQTHRGLSAIATGVLLTPATIGILISSALAKRFAQRRAQASLIQAGFATTAIGMILLVTLVSSTHSGFWAYAPGLLLMGIGIGTMLTSSVNVVQSSFPETDQAMISGLSRCVSNLGSSLGTAIVGSFLVVDATHDKQHFGLALFSMFALTLVGLLIALRIPRQTVHGH